MIVDSLKILRFDAGAASEFPYFELELNDRYRFRVEVADHLVDDYGADAIAPRALQAAREALGQVDSVTDLCLDPVRLTRSGWGRASQFRRPE
jgi:hypothetical protein